MKSKIPSNIATKIAKHIYIYMEIHLRWIHSEVMGLDMRGLPHPEWKERERCWMKSVWLLYLFEEV